MNEKRHLLVSSYYDRTATDPELRRLEPFMAIRRCEEGRRLTEDELCQRLSGVDVTLVSDDPFTERVFKASPRLRMICCDGVGFDHIDIKAATAHGVIVNNAPVVHEANGDFTIGLIIALLRRILPGDRGIRNGRWGDRELYLGQDLAGKTLGLLGFGRVARSVAKRASVFGMRVICYSPHADSAAAAAHGAEIVTFADLLRRSDILSVHVTLNEGTRGLIGQDAISQMKSGAYFINTSRGAVIDEAALASALRSGKLAGAALDVFVEEPLNADHPLLQIQNLIATPHIGSDTADTFRRVFASAVDDILMLLNGQLPAHIVNGDVLNHPSVRCINSEAAGLSEKRSRGMQ